MLPLAERSLAKLTRVVDEEMRSVDAQKLSMPSLLPAALWERSGRWAKSDDSLFRVRDRRDAEYCIAPTHEEPFTDLVANEVSSYRQLPLRLYQIGSKFRDEMRPRYGLLRGREFVMKDLYTFDESREAALETYDLVSAAYERIFSRLELPAVKVQADSGDIGGDYSHEFHVPCLNGEDVLLKCSDDACGYAANLERAVGALPPDFQPAHDSRSIDTIRAVLPDSTEMEAALRPLAELSCFLYKHGETGETAACLIASGAGQPNPLSLPKGLVHTETLPSSSQPALYIDRSALSIDNAPPSSHDHVHCGDYREAAQGDLCPQCDGGRLESSRGIEVGHVFYLGQVYSRTLGATFADHDGKEQVAEMGCFGLGISRILAAFVESQHDEQGIRFSPALAPFQVALLPMKKKFLDDALRIGSALGDDALVDDRVGLSAGVRLTDAELIGFPFVALLGKSYPDALEVRDRRTGEKHMVEEGQLDAFLRQKCSQ